MWWRYIFGLLLAGAGWVMTASGLAAGLDASLQLERERVPIGEEVSIAVIVEGEGSHDEWRIKQPELGTLRYFSLVSVRQRNRTRFDEDGGSWSTSFVYRLKAEEPGEESVPSIRVYYHREDEEEDRVVSAPGCAIHAVPGGIGKGWILMAVVLVAAAAGAVALMCRRRYGGVEVESPSVEEKEKEWGPVAEEALRRVESARSFRIAGDSGAYAAALRDALKVCVEEDMDTVFEEIRRDLAELGERVKYGIDREAEREIDERARRAEIQLKRRVRSGTRE